MPWSLLPVKLSEELSKPVYNEQQNLGRSVGRIHITCTYRSDRSKWTRSSDDTHLSAILYFNLGYREVGSNCIRSATVQVDVGENINGPPAPILRACAPSRAIKGESLSQHIVDSRVVDPHGELSIPVGLSFGASGYRREISTEYEFRHNWSFVAGFPPNNQDTRTTKADFTWTRTSPCNRTSEDRLYDGAIVLQSATDKPLVMRVSVDARLWNWPHRKLRPRGAFKDSRPIGAQTEKLLERTDFAWFQDNIEQEILSSNLSLAPIGERIL